MWINILVYMWMSVNLKAMIFLLNTRGLYVSNTCYHVLHLIYINIGVCTLNVCPKLLVSSMYPDKINMDEKSLSETAYSVAMNFLQTSISFCSILIMPVAKTKIFEYNLSFLRLSLISFKHFS